MSDLSTPIREVRMGHMAAHAETASDGVVHVRSSEQLAAYPRMLASAAASCEPHRMAFYLQDLAALFHALWNSGKERPELRFIQEDKPEQTLARLGLLRATAIVLACGLDVIGVEPEVELR